ncbi:MAG TPA: hypothetical protein DIT97_29910 [Gimesia maris]|uniref:Uncharacterized protein n=1 Tax=Gimesia maris TaxID=122 RepID=A0A3D3RG60_9PLAN|nr:hypothetical protein [Gimesia maris]
MLKKGEADPTYGSFEYRDQIVQFQPDGDLRDYEDVPLNADTARGANVDLLNESFFAEEVRPYHDDAWIDRGKKDKRDGEVGLIGYEIPINQYFHEYDTPRDLVEIDNEINELKREILQLLSEVQS